MSQIFTRKQGQSPESRHDELQLVGHMEPNRIGVKTIADLKRAKELVIKGLKQTLTPGQEELIRLVAGRPGEEGGMSAKHLDQFVEMAILSPTLVQKLETEALNTVTRGIKDHPKSWQWEGPRAKQTMEKARLNQTINTLLGGEQLDVQQHELTKERLQEYELAGRMGAEAAKKIFPTLTHNQKEIIRAIITDPPEAAAISEADTAEFTTMAIRSPQLIEAIQRIFMNKVTRGIDQRPEDWYWEGPRAQMIVATANLNDAVNKAVGREVLSVAEYELTKDGLKNRYKKQHEA